MYNTPDLIGNLIFCSKECIFYHCFDISTIFTLLEYGLSYNYAYRIIEILFCQELFWIFL